MHTIPSPSPPISAKKLALQSLPLSPAPYATYDGDDDGPTAEEKPSGRRQHDPDSADKTSSSKKARHRHSPAQLAALNELFERNEHPALDERTELAQRLGMEIKTVNAWFQNKRASTKKRNKPSPSQADHPEKSSKPSTLPSIANLLNATPQPSHRPHPSSRKSRQKDLHLNDPPHAPNSVTEPALEGSFFAGFSGQERFILSHHRGRHPEFDAVPQLHNSDPDRMLPDTDNRFVSENDALPARRGRSDVARMRTSPEQAEQLRRAYALNDHPTREQRQHLADRIGMRLQSVTNWFQNQRSQAKKHREDSELSVPQPSAGADGPPTPLPPRSHHPSLAIPEHDPRSSLPNQLSAGVDDHREGSTPRSRMSLPPSLSSRMSSPRIRRGAPPYARDSKDLHADEGRHYAHTGGNLRAEDTLVRPRRSRPEPHQLDALKKLLQRTLTPSLDERSALASEIGMDIGKVTNWFRNIRQNTRKRAKRPRASAASGHSHEHDASSGSSVYDDDDAMDLVCDDTADQEMDDRSEEDYQEAVTPFTDVSASPPPNKRSRSHLPVDSGMSPMDVGLVGPSAFPEFTKVVGMASVGPNDDDMGMNAMTYSGVKLEDALLLLSFHQHVVH